MFYPSGNQWKYKYKTRRKIITVERDKLFRLRQDQKHKERKGLTTMCNEYNGYKNYPAWNVNLWIDNDSGLYDYVQELAIEAYNNATESVYISKRKDAIYTLEKQFINCFLDELNPLAESASMYSDILGWALESINWHEVAENWINEAIENGWVEVETELDLQD